MSPTGVRRLVIQLARMGDLMQTRPLLARLRAADGNGPIALAVFAGLEPLAAMIPEVDAIIPVPPLAGAGRNLAERWSEAEKALGPLFGTEWDETYVLNDAPAARYLARLAGGVARGFAPDGVDGVGPDWPMRLFRLAAAHRRAAGLHLADFWAALAPEGTPWPDPSMLRVPERAVEEANEILVRSGIRGSEQFVVLAPGARHPARRWPAASFGELTRLLGGRGVRVVLAGDESEAGITAEVISVAGAGPADLTGRTPLPVLAAVLARARVLVSNNTGTLHLADAVGTKVVGIYLGPAWCHETSPGGSGQLVFQTESSCAPCPDHRQVCGGFDCAGLLPVKEVLRAVESRIAGAVPETGADSGVSLYRTVRTAGLRACIPIPGGDAGGLLRALSHSVLSAPLGANAGVGDGNAGAPVFRDLLQKAHWILSRTDDDPGRESRDAEEIERLKEMDPAFAFLGEALSLAVGAGRRKEALDGLEQVLRNSRGGGKCRSESAPAAGSLTAA